MIASPHLSDLAVSMHHSPGVYALLLGSGLSMAAGIPTAWGIVTDLVRQKARAEGVEPLPEDDTLFAWYKETFGKDASYSDLIAQIAPTSASQQTLLRSYFEQDVDGDRRPHEPSRAHRAIARLCQAGLLRMIITTNFDRLMEQALAEVGVTCHVISNEHEIAAAPPLVHGGVFILKLHGDYLKADVRNSPDDLVQYPERLRTYLDRVVDEFGLIVCGWSGEWDHALRQAILQAPNRRYPLFWSAYQKPSPGAQELIDARQGRMVMGLDADTFFEQLEGRALALRDLHWTPPQDALALAAEVKRYLAHPQRDGARLTDLIERVCDDLHAAVRQPVGPPMQQGIQAGLTWAMGVSTPLLHVLGAVLKYDRSNEWIPLLTEALTRIDWAAVVHGVPMTETERQVRQLPFLLVAMAAAGLGGAHNKPEILTFLQADPYRQPHTQRYTSGEAIIYVSDLNANEQLAKSAEFMERAAPLRFWMTRELQRELTAYLNPASTYEDLSFGSLLLALIGLDDMLVRPTRPDYTIGKKSYAKPYPELSQLNPLKFRAEKCRFHRPKNLSQIKSTLTRTDNDLRL
ncbi:SIR2 family protein [Deinococcus wulumuqiensis]|uniref:SIR2 family protein n=1 Tax=Deinococcus wulumuqiensis TaxID=980427 RepID=UPI0013C2AC9D|nr:SIR2 family protein [Deinococcus wulumuqiensis]